MVSTFFLWLPLSGGLALVQTPRDVALIDAAARGDNTTVPHLVKDGASVTARDTSGRTAFLTAVQNNLIGVARLLIGAGANVNLADKRGVPPLAHARSRGQIEVAAILVKTEAK